MAVGEEYTNSLKTLEENFDKYSTNQCKSYSYGSSSISYMKGYIESILDIVRPIVIIKFILALIFLIISLVLFVVHLKRK